MNEAQAVGKALTERETVQLINGLTRTGASMKLKDLADIVEQSGGRLAGSISPGRVENLLTTNISAKLKEAFTKWGEGWKQWTASDQSDYMDEQVREVVAQIGEMPALADTGGTFQEIAAPTISEVSFTIGGYGGFMSVDMKTQRSDHLNYFSKLGERMGRSAISALHTYIYNTMLSDNPTYTGDSVSLFDNSNHLNDAGAGAVVTLTYDHLATSITQFGTIVDADDEPLTLGQRVILVCGIPNQENAEQLIKNPEKPGTANREINTLKSRIIGIDVSRKLTTEWYLVPEQSEVESLVMTFYEGKDTPSITMEPKTSSFQFERPGVQRWREDMWFGGSYTWPVIVRGSGA